MAPLAPRAVWRCHCLRKSQDANGQLFSTCARANVHVHLHVELSLPLFAIKWGAKPPSWHQMESTMQQAMGLVGWK